GAEIHPAPALRHPGGTSQEGAALQGRLGGVRPGPGARSALDQLLGTVPRRQQEGLRLPGDTQGLPGVRRRVRVVLDRLRDVTRFSVQSPCAGCYNLREGKSPDSNSEVVRYASRLSLERRRLAAGDAAGPGRPRTTSGTPTWSASWPRAAGQDQ